jgi:hypothetical protein
MMIRSPLLDRVLDAHRAKAVLLRELAVSGVLAVGDDHLDAAIAEVLGVGMSLRSVTEDRDRLALESIDRGVLLVDHLQVGHDISCPSRAGKTPVGA